MAIQVKPPWGSLCAVNLNTGEIEWKVVLGEYHDLTKRGIPPTGTQLFGGGVVTAGGGGMQGTESGDYYYAFKLPEKWL